MGLFRDRRDRRDLSLKVCWTLAQSGSCPYQCGVRRRGCEATADRAASLLCIASFGCMDPELFCARIVVFE
jgi:hypothetical protein